MWLDRVLPIPALPWPTQAGCLSTLVAFGLAGCGAAPPPARPAPSERSAAAAPARPSLMAEQRRLAALFRGTPVVFAMQPDGSLKVEVPLRYCFDPGRAGVKPPLAAVLDRVAKSQRDAATHVVVTASTDPGAKSLALATERAVAVRQHLADHGIAAARFSISAVNSASGVRLVVSPPPVQ